MSEIPELRSCPFCGEPAIFRVADDNFSEFIECSKCRCTTPLAEPQKDECKSVLAYIWNRRDQEDTANGWVQAGECIEQLWKQEREDLEAKVAEQAGKLLIYEEAGRPEWIAEQSATIQRLTEALQMLYDEYENGDPCTEYGDEDGGYMGNAVKLSPEEDDQVLAALESAGIKTALSFTVDGTPKADAALTQPAAKEPA